MSGYEVAFYPDALKDLKRLDGSQRKHVFKAIERIRTNPLPQNEGGFGKPLGNKAGTDLTGFMKIKLRGSGSVEKVGVRALAAPVSDIRNQLIS